MTKPLVLAVDDDPVNLSIISLSLEEAPLDLRFASDGQAALDLLNDETLRFDLIVLDRMMPGIDGMEVLRRLKASPRLKTLPVIMQTAAAVPNQVEEGLRAGAYYYLTKPYSPEALRTLVVSALEDSERKFQLQQRESKLGKALASLNRAAFSIRTLDEAMDLTDVLCTLCPDPSTAWTGLKELLANAVEHGNLAISYEQKRELKLQERWREELDRRAELPEYRTRRVVIELERTASEIRFIIRDEGEGFAWRRYLDFDPARAFDPNGRGIALARALCFRELYYEGSGNVAVATIAIAS